MDNMKLLTGLLILSVIFLGCVQNPDNETTTTLPSGETTIASGEVSVMGDVVCLNYIGSFENGTVFDTNIEDVARDAGLYDAARSYAPLCFAIGDGMVIAGFEDGVKGMAVGESKTITVPPEKGYPYGQLAGETLIFEVTLLEIKETSLEMIVLSDKRCADCDASGVIKQLEMVFPGIKVKELDYGTEEGKQLYDDLGLVFLPAVLFDESVKSEDGYVNIQNFLEKAGDYYSLRIGATFDPAAEICDNGVDDNDDGLVDCDDDSCSLNLVCNKDALTECSANYNLTADTVIFYHSLSCGWCQKMMPLVEDLQSEGYNFHWADVSDAESRAVVDDCFSDYLTSGSVPQFICVNNGEIKVGAFPDDEGMKVFADACIAG